MKNSSPDRISQEKVTVQRMVTLFCNARHRSDRPDENGLCPECSKLVIYAHNRLSKCPYGNDKGSCRKCPIHCYSPQMRETIREVMRYCGPRMLIHDPVNAVKHLLDELFT